jgi:hypothetical protein
MGRCIGAARRLQRGHRVRGCSSDGRALQSHCRGQGFDSPQLHQPRPVTLKDVRQLSIVAMRNAHVVCGHGWRAACSLPCGRQQRNLVSPLSLSRRRHHFRHRLRRCRTPYAGRWLPGAPSAWRRPVPRAPLWLHRLPRNGGSVRAPREALTQQRLSAPPLPGHDEGCRSRQLSRRMRRTCGPASGVGHPLPIQKIRRRGKAGERIAIQVGCTGRRTGRCARPYRTRYRPAFGPAAPDVQAALVRPRCVAPARDATHDIQRRSPLRRSSIS